MAEIWIKAQSPNYETHKDKLFPYSEMPFQRTYKLVLIPICIKNLIDHVDYLGYGRRELDEGTIGFLDCYNVNYEYLLVPDGRDKDRKIPNRIPIIREEGRFGYTTTQYLKDNSVFIVTVNLENEVTEILAQDIARIVNSERGKVIVYGHNDVEIETIADQLRKKKQLFYCPIYLLPDHLLSTYWNTCHRTYLNINELKKELYRHIKKGDFEAAVILTECLNNVYCNSALGDVVNKLLENNIRNVIVYAYKLWYNNGKDVVRKHFPSLFKQIFMGECLAIVNKHDNQALVLDSNTTKAHGDGWYKAGNKSSWKIIPILNDNNVNFKIYNVSTELYLQQPSDAKHSKEPRDTFHFEPLNMNGQIAFKILYDNDDKPLKLPVDATANSDHEEENEEMYVENDERTLSDIEEYSNVYVYDK